jgi:hypothetical protein
MLSYFKMQGVILSNQKIDHDEIEKDKRERKIITRYILYIHLIRQK